MADIIDNLQLDDCQEAILYISRYSTKSQSEMIKQKLQHIIGNNDLSEHFCLTLIENLLIHFDLAEDFYPNIMLIGAAISHEQGTTEISQLAINVMVKYITKMQSQINSEMVDLLKLQLVSARDAKSMVVYIRFFEVAVRLAVASESLCQEVSKPIIHEVFLDFFGQLSSDILTQVTIMDFVVKLSESPFGIKLMNESDFINRLFETFAGTNEDSFGFITSNMLLVGAKLYQIDPLLFNPFENLNFMSMFKSYLLGPVNIEKPHHKDIALSCLCFLFSQKE